MEARSGQGGRPARGYAKGYRTMLFAPESEHVEAAKVAGVPYQDFLEAIVKIGLRHQDELPAHLCPALMLDTEEVPLRAAG